MNIIGDVGARLHPDRRHRRFRRHAVQRRRRAAEANGATSVSAYITHGVLSGGAVFRAALSANQAAADHMGRAFYAQAIREYSVGLRIEGRDHLEAAWAAYARSGNQALKNRRFAEVNAALTQLGEAPLAAA
jgi:hypothetical protein